MVKILFLIFFGNAGVAYASCGSGRIIKVELLCGVEQDSKSRDQMFGYRGINTKQTTQASESSFLVTGGRASG